MTELTGRQQQILGFIQGRHETEGLAPSLREIAAGRVMVISLTTCPWLLGNTTVVSLPSVSGQVAGASVYVHEAPRLARTVVPLQELHLKTVPLAQSLHEDELDVLANR